MLPFSFSHYTKIVTSALPYDRVRDLLNKYTYSSHPTLPVNELKRLKAELRSTGLPEVWAKTMALEASRISNIPLANARPINQMSPEEIEELQKKRDNVERALQPVELELIKKAVLCGAKIETLMGLSAFTKKVLELAPRYKAALDSILNYVENELDNSSPEVAAYWLCYAYPEGISLNGEIYEENPIRSFFKNSGYDLPLADFDFFRANNRVFGLYTSNKNRISGTLMFLYMIRRTIAAAFYSPDANKKIPKRGRPLKLLDSGALTGPRIYSSENFFYLSNIQTGLEYRPTTSPQNWPMIFVGPHQLAAAVRMVKCIESILGRRSEIPSEVLAARLLWRLRGIALNPSNDVMTKLYALVRTNNTASVRLIPNMMHMLSFENALFVNPGTASAEITERLTQIINDLNNWDCVRRA